MAGSYLMFHWVQGVPFEFNAGAYDNLNMWEQIDDGEQYTPTKKFLLSVPIILFLVSTHYTHYDFTYFTINLLATLAVVIPKLPAVSLPAAHPLSQFRRENTSDTLAVAPPPVRHLLGGPIRASMNTNSMALEQAWLVAHLQAAKR